MAVLAADALCSTVAAVRLAKYPASGADTFYKGALLFLDAATNTVQAVPAAGDRCVGICPHKQVITAANEEVEVIVSGLVWVPIGTGVAVDNSGTRLILDISATQSDNPADSIPEADASGGLADNDIAIGRIDRVATGKMRIAVDHGGVTGDLYLATGGFGWAG